MSRFKPQRRSARALTWELRDSAPDVLYITNMWPDEVRRVYGIFVKRQVDSLRAQGVRCDVLYVRGYLGAHAYALSALYFVALPLLARRRYKLIHAHAGETALVARCATGAPVLASYCGDDILGYANSDGSMPLMRRIRSWFVRQHSSLFSATITKSREMELALPARSRCRNYVIPNGVNREAFAPMPREQARTRLGWSPDQKIVLFAATRPFEVRKRLDLAKAAVEHAKRRIIPIRLVIAENCAPQDLPILMNASDCLLLTSRSEGSPNAVKEALMCDLPVVATDAGDTAELLDGVANSYVCSDDAAELGERLADVLESDERSDGRTRKGAELDEKRIAARVLEVYRSLGLDVGTNP